ncbi:MAG: hypothetical protein KGI08_07980 [Thaumarchaeota archaeon]|nr:hypothetical protein [Nitrososphaerota archaeon]
MSDYEDKGIAGSFKYGQNLDPRKQKDSLTAGQGITDDLATGTMTAGAYVTVSASDGNTYFFCYDGKIFSRHSDGTYHLVYTDTNESGNIIGAAEWYYSNGDTYLVYATPTRLNIKKILGTGYTPVEPWTDLNTGIGTGTWPKTNLTSAPWHTMKISNGVLVIANLNTAAIVGYDLSYSNAGLQLIPGNKAIAIVERGKYGVIGCYRGDSQPISSLFAWDGISTNWNDKALIPVDGLNAMIDTEFALAQIGTDGFIYLSDMNTLMPIRKIRDGGYCHPGAVTNYKGMAFFGIFGNASLNNGIYSYGRINKNANPILNHEYFIDCDEIYSVQTVGSDVFIQYRKGTAYGVKKIDWSNKADAIYQTLDLIAPLGTRRYPIPLGRLLNWERIDLQCSPLPAGCKIEVWYRPDKQTTQRTLANGTQTDANGWIQANMDTGNTGGGLQAVDTGKQNFIFYLSQTARVMEIMVKLFHSGNTTPEVNEINAYFTVG